MEYVQLDKNTGDKRLRDVCLGEGVIGCELLPKNIRDAEDPEVLEYVIEHGFVTFTFDRRIHIEWSEVLEGRNPGIVILRRDDDALQQINTRTAPRHLREFKAQFPDWHAVPYRHSVVEVTPTLIFVYHTLDRTPIQTMFAERAERDWQEQLVRHLTANARGNPFLVE